jgi:hypothetical protein
VGVRDLRRKDNTSRVQEMTDEQAFMEWYKHYPKKKAVGDAKKAWGQVKKDRIALEEMIKILKLQCQQEDWRKGGGQFIPYPATYLRRLQFLDEMEVALPEDEIGWRDTWQGIVKKGREFGLTEDMFEQPYQFKAAVLAKAEGNNVYKLREA